MAIQTPRIESLQNVDPGIRPDDALDGRTLFRAADQLGQAVSEVKETRDLKKAISIFEDMETSYQRNELDPAIRALNKSNTLALEMEDGVMFAPDGGMITEGAASIARNLGLLEAAAPQGFNPGGLQIRKEAYILQATRQNPGLAPLLNRALQIQSGLGGNGQTYVTSYWENLLAEAQKNRKADTQLTAQQQIEAGRKLNIHIEAYNNQFDFARDLQNAAQLLNEREQASASYQAGLPEFRTKVVPTLMQQYYAEFQSWLATNGITEKNASSLSMADIQQIRVSWKAYSDVLVAQWANTYTGGRKTGAEFQKEELSFVDGVLAEVDKISEGNLTSMFGLIKDRETRQAVYTVFGGPTPQLIFKTLNDVAASTGMAGPKTAASLAGMAVIRSNIIGMSQLGVKTEELYATMKANGVDVTSGQALAELNKVGPTSSQIWGGDPSPEQQQLQLGVVNSLIASGQNPKNFDTPEFTYQNSLFLQGLDYWYRNPGMAPSKTVASKSLEYMSTTGFQRLVQSLPPEKREEVFAGAEKAVLVELGDISQRLAANEGFDPQTLADILNRPQLKDERFIDIINRYAGNLAIVLEFQTPAGPPKAYPNEGKPIGIRYNRGRYEFYSRDTVDSRTGQAQSAVTARLNRTYGTELNRALQAYNVLLPPTGAPGADLRRSAQTAAEQGEQAILGR